MNLIRRLAVIIVALGSVSVAQANPIITIEFEVTTIFTTIQHLEDGAILRVTYDPTIMEFNDGIYFCGYCLIRTFSLDGSPGTGEGGVKITVFNDILDPTFALIDKVVLFATDAQDEMELVQIGSASILNDLSFPSLEQFFSFEFGTVSHNRYSGIYNPQTGKVVTVPEPSTLALFSLGILGLALGRKRAA